MEWVEQSKEELKEQLRDQVRFMRRSATAFDEGDESEAKRLAVNLRVLLHDTDSSHSLLGLLGLKPVRRSDASPDDMLFWDTAKPYNHRNLIPSFDGLTWMQVLPNQPVKYVPALDHLEDRTSKRVPFFDWWFRLVYIDVLKNQFSRKSLILAVANQDGGAHIDPKLKADYAALSRQNSMGWDLTGNSATITVSLKSDSPIELPKGQQSTPVFPSIRQITYEMLKSLEAVVPDCFD
jgi:hypothetical protein